MGKDCGAPRTSNSGNKAPKATVRRKTMTIPRPEEVAVLLIVDYEL